jgi:hypothetical protein
MSIGQIIVLTAIVGAFVLFAAVLAWEDYRAQQLVHRIRDRDRKEAALTASAMALKKDDKSAAAASETAKARWPQPSDDRLQHVA